MINITLPTHVEVLQAFAEYEVKFLLVGGYAVIHYGYHRTTGDMDIWIDPCDENKKRLVAAFRSMDYEADSLRQLEELDFTLPTVFSIGEQPEKIDFMTKVTLVKFDDAYEHRVDVVLDDGVAVSIIQYKDLILSKMNTGRLKDKADIEQLQKLHSDRDKSNQ